jgi:zinc protease
VNPEQVMPLVDQVLEDFFADGPDEQILENSKLAVNVAMLGNLERNAAIGNVLAEGFLYSDNPLFLNTELRWLNDATQEDIRVTTKRWLNRPYYQLTVLPFPDYEVASTDVDRSVIPAVSDGSDIQFPDIEVGTLNNGMKVVVAQRGSIPLIDVVFRIGSGETAAPADAHALADFVFMLSDKGTKKFDAGELAAARDRIAMGGRLGAATEYSTYSYRILSSKLDESLAIAEEVLRNPVFPEDEIGKLQQQLGGLLATLQKAPSSAAGSLYERAIYGAGSPMDGVWHPENLDEINRDNLMSFHEDEVAPDNIAVFMIGDIDLAAATAALNRAFGSWKAGSNSARKPIGKAAPAGARVILVDQPGAVSSTVVAGHALPPFDPEKSAELDILNQIFGGSFESRLNMNLREDKAWSYGYSSGIDPNTSGDQLLTMSGQVQTDRTAPAMEEIRREFVEFAGDRPATNDEVERAKINRIRSLPGNFETNSGFLQSMLDSDSYGLPYDYAAGRADRYRAVTTDGVAAAAEALFRPADLVWVVVGDLGLIEDEVRALDYGPVEVWNAFGERLR